MNSSMFRFLIAMVLCFSFAATSVVNAEQTKRYKAGVKLQLKPGVTVQVSGNKGRMYSARANVSGTFDCGCTGGSGSCTLSQEGSFLICYKGGTDTCTAECRLSTRIPSIGAGAALYLAR